jgi:ubiquinone/menaquinone biosynthesis C-methylase UbiE
MFPSKLTDRKYLLEQQYRSAANLKARIHLHQRFSTNSYDWFLWLFDQIELPPAAHILELGCGPGDLWERNSARLPRGWWIALADLSTDMARQAQQSLSKTRHPFFYTAADAQSIPFPGASFDAVIANHMLYHVPDLAGGLAEIARVLRRGGRLYAATNGAAHMRDLFDLVNSFHPDLNYGVKAIRFNLENGAQLLAPFFAQVECRRYENGLVVTEVEPLVAYVLSMSSAYGSNLFEHAAELHDFIQAEMDRSQGQIPIRKDAGLYVAQKE